MNVNVAFGVSALVLALALSLGIGALRDPPPPPSPIPALAGQALAPDDIQAIVVARGYRDASAPRRRADAYFVGVIDADGRRRTLVVDAFDGALLGEAGEIATAYAPSRVAGAD